MRNEIKLTDAEIAEVFNGAFGECIDPEDVERLVWTRDTIDGFVEAAKDYNECGPLKRGEERGFTTLEMNRIQVRKGDTRRDAYIVDFGSVRAVY